MAVICNECKGSGVEWVLSEYMPGDYGPPGQRHAESCWRCNGTGYDPRWGPPPSECDGMDDDDFPDTASARENEGLSVISEEMVSRAEDAYDKAASPDNECQWQAMRAALNAVLPDILGGKGMWCRGSSGLPMVTGPGKEPLEVRTMLGHSSVKVTETV